MVPEGAFEGKTLKLKLNGERRQAGLSLGEGGPSMIIQCSLHMSAGINNRVIRNILHNSCFQEAYFLTVINNCNV